MVSVTESLGCANLVGRWVALLGRSSLLMTKLKVKALKKMHWLAAGLVGSLLCLAAPVRAGELSSWKFDPSSNRLEFNTETGVQPRAQLVTGPTRLVIDLPGTTWSRSQILEALGGSFQNLRISQYDENTARIIVELAPGYTIDPSKIEFRGISPTQWTVQLPQPQPEAGGSTTAQAPISQPPTASSRTSSARSAQPASSAAPTNARSPQPGRSAQAADSSITQVDTVRMTGEGLVVQTRGATPDVKIEPDENDERFITLTIRNAQLANPELDGQRITTEQFGVRNIEIEQRSRDRVRIKFQVNRDSGEWRAARVSDGVVALPSDRRVLPTTTAAASTPRSATVLQAPPQAPRASEDEPATIEGFGFNEANSQLLIQSDRPVSASGGWNSGRYEVRLSPARLGRGVNIPPLPSDGALLQARVSQADDQTVVVSMFPRSGTQFSGVTSQGNNVLALGFGRSTSASSNLRLPSNPGQNPRPSSPLPTIQSGRAVVIVDPGHGGSDPGAVGIGGIQEADVVLDISQQVASILEQQGVQVVITRNSDVDVELQPRVDIAEQANATLFVSIHANAIDMSRPDVNGTSVYYYSSGQALAQTVQDAIVQDLGMQDRGIHTARFFVLRKTSMPSILVETAFVTGADDAKKLADSNWRSQMASAIASGVLQYLQGRSR
jgi:N-acetylmuramoyl-L-alanine amidase